MCIQWGKGGSAPTFPISFSEMAYNVVYCDIGGSDIDWKDRLKSRSATGFSIAESKNSHFYIAIGKLIEE